MYIFLSSERRLMVCRTLFGVIQKIKIQKIQSLSLLKFFVFGWAFFITQVNYSEIVDIPEPEVSVVNQEYYRDRAYVFFKETGSFELHNIVENKLANGSSVVVAQIEKRLAANEQVVSGKEIVYHQDSDGDSDRITNINDHSNFVGSLFYSSFNQQYAYSRYTLNFSPGIKKVHAFTTDAYRTILDSSDETLGTHGINIVNISNTMGCGCEYLRIRKHDKMLADENILAFHAHPGSAIGSFSHSTWNGLVVNQIGLNFHNSGANTIYENIVIDGEEIQRQSPTIVSLNCGLGFEGASSYATPNAASAGALLLDYAQSSKKLNATNNLVIKSILLTGAEKELPSYPHYAWSQSSDRPLDPIMGAGNLNVKNSYLIINQAEGLPGTDLKSHYGWNVSTVSNNEFRAYRFKVYNSSQLTSTLCWHRDIENDFSSFSLANLSMHLEQWDSETNSWQLVFTSDSAGNNIEHIYQSIEPGEFRLLVSSLNNRATEYGLSWRIDPIMFKPLKRFYSSDVTVLSEAPDYTSEFTIEEQGRCSVTATTVEGGTVISSLNIEKKLESGEWEIVETEDRQFLYKFLSADIAPGVYRVKASMNGPFDKLTLRLSYRVDIENNLLNSDNQMLLDELRTHLAPNALGFLDKNDHWSLYVKTPLFLKNKLNRFELRKSSNLLEWFQASDASTNTYEAMEGNYKMNWLISKEQNTDKNLFFSLQVSD